MLEGFCADSETEKEAKCVYEGLKRCTAGIINMYEVHELLVSNKSASHVSKSILPSFVASVLKGEMGNINQVSGS